MERQTCRFASCRLSSVICGHSDLALLLSNKAQCMSVVLLTTDIHFIPSVPTTDGVKKSGTAVNPTCQGSLLACHIGHACHRLVIPGRQDKMSGHYTLGDQMDLLTPNKFSLQMIQTVHIWGVGSNVRKIHKHKHCQFVAWRTVRSAGAGSSQLNFLPIVLELGQSSRHTNMECGLHWKESLIGK
jgi:hypothetical protein